MLLRHETFLSSRSNDWTGSECLRVRMAAFGGHYFGEGFFLHYDHHFSRRFRPLLHPAIINISQATDDDDHESFQDGQAKRPSNPFMPERWGESAFIAE